MHTKSPLVIFCRQQFRLLDLLSKLDGQPTQFSSKPSQSTKKDLPSPERKECGSQKNKSSKHKGKRPDPDAGKLVRSSKASKSDEKHSAQENRSGDVLKRLLSGGDKYDGSEGVSSPVLADQDVGSSLADEDGGVWPGVDSKKRPSSGRLTGLRGELLTAEKKRHHSEGEEGSKMTRQSSSTSSRRPESGRTSGLRGEMKTASKSIECRAVSKSGRTSGLCGELTQQNEESKDKIRSPLSSERDSPVAVGGRDDVAYGPRLHTAVLAQGYRPLVIGASGSDSCLLPEITSTLDCRDTDDMVSG